MPPKYQPFRPVADMPTWQVDGIRYYQTPHGWMPSITTVFKLTKSEEDMAAIERWRDREGHAKADRIRDLASRNGNILHAALEDWIKGIEVKPAMMGPRHWHRFKCIRDHLESYTAVHMLEAAVYSKKYRIAGRLDCFGQKTPREYQIIDFKTSRKVKQARYIEHYFMQASFYAQAISECYPGINAKTYAILVANDIPRLQVFEGDVATYLPKVEEAATKFHAEHPLPKELQ